MIKIGSKAKKIIERDKKIFLTTTRVPYSFVSDHAEGEYAYDIEGNKFIDFSSYVAVYSFGLNETKEIRSAVKTQIDKLMHSAFTDYYSALPVEFGEQLLTMFPKGFGKLFLSNSGTEANEAAAKFARIFTGKNYIMSFYNSFHGRSLGSLAFTSHSTVQREHFGPFPYAMHVPYPYCYRCPFHMEYPSCGFACIDYIKEYPLQRETSSKEIAGFIAEPIQGEGGYIVPPKDYFKKLKKLLDSEGILLIDDEIQAGYMRAGSFLALDKFGVTADIYTMAKAAGGGLPLGITVVSNAIGDIPPGSHATTFGGNLASVAAAYALLKHLKSNMKKVESDIEKKSSFIMKRLKEMQENYELLGDVRGMGMMIGIELVKSKKTKEPAPEEVKAVLVEAFNNGLLLLPAGDSSIRIIPPIIISMENLAKGLDILEAAIKRVNSTLKK
ncbi:MAG: aminotransferase class III-fold pyridoxal phosphate-dependent enzyme [Candidatus Micrarchaeia archaeon]